MKRQLFLALAALSLTAFPAAARQAAKAPVAVAPDQSVTFEYYYRIRWGSELEFIRLYEKNHAPLLEEMRKAGFIRSMKVEQPFTHMAGGERWDLRVTIVFRDAQAAIGDPEWDRLWAAATKRLYPDEKTFDAEETLRFTLLEEHWDVIVVERPS